MENCNILNLYDKPKFHGKFLIEASAGTGKTFSISQLFLHAILQGKKIDEILVLSFTEDATKELNDRIRKNLSDVIEKSTESPFSEILANYQNVNFVEILRNAMSEMDKAAIYTIHGFCNRVLNEFAFECGTAFGLELHTDSSPITQQVILDHCRRNSNIALTLFNNYAENFLNNSASFPKYFDEKYVYFYDALEKVKNEYKLYKKEKNILVYDDMIQNLYNVLKLENNSLLPILREKFTLAFVDEFQDTDFCQYEIINTIFGQTSTHGFYMIGDPKQSIYRFRGADINVYLAAKKSAEKVFTLDTNYRSEKAMVNAVNEIFLKRDKSFGLNDLIFSKTTAKDNCRKLCGIDDNRLIYCFDLNEKFVINEIKKIVDCDTIYFKKDENKRRINFSDFAILCNTNVECKNYLTACLTNGFPAVIKSGESIFASDEAKNFLHLITAICNPRKKEITKFLLLFCEYSPDQILKIAPEDFEMINKLFIKLKKSWDKSGVITAFYQFLEAKIIINDFSEVIKKRLINLNRGERKLTNYQQLAEILNNKENGEFDLQKTFNFLQHEVNAEKKDEENSQLLETDAQAIQIMTIHKAKGLEFPIVFVPTAFQKKPSRKGRYHPFIYFDEELKENIFVPKFDAENFEKYQNYSRMEEVQENLRVLYVALTRSVNLCYVGLLSEEKVPLQDYLFSDVSMADLLTPPTEKNKQLPNQDFLQLKSDLKILNDGETVERKEEKLILIQPKEISLKPDFWGVSSFTGISHDAHADENSVKDYDELEVQEIFEKPEGIFGLPRGKDFGVAVHKVFENFFNFGPDSFYQNKIVFLEKPFIFDNSFALENNGAEKFMLAEKMVENVLKSSLHFGNEKIILANLNLNKCKTELSFFYNLQRLTPEKLINIFAKNGEERMAEKLKLLDFRMIEGFMTGFIDLIFEENDKFYIVDWKTNYLGANQKFYKKENVENAVFNAFYFLQFYIYSLALHLHLNKSKKNYSFDKNFGGVAYLFVRGINPENPNDGIFFHQPKIKIIQELFKL